MGKEITDFHLSRRDLGLKVPKRPKVGLGVKRFFFVHHAAIPDTDGAAFNGPDNHDQCIDMYHAIRAMHINKGWGDIGYNFVICPHAVDFEGVGGDYVGAHCPNFNRNGLGVCYLGNGDKAITTAAQWRIAELYHTLSYYRGGRMIVKNHRDERQTHCCGNWLANWTNKNLKILSPR